MNRRPLDDLPDNFGWPAIHILDTLKRNGGYSFFRFSAQPFVEKLHEFGYVDFLSDAAGLSVWCRWRRREVLG